MFEEIFGDLSVQRFRIRKGRSCVLWPVSVHTSRRWEMSSSVHPVSVLSHPASQHFRAHLHLTQFKPETPAMIANAVVNTNSIADICIILLKRELRRGAIKTGLDVRWMESKMFLPFFTQQGSHSPRDVLGYFPLKRILQNTNWWNSYHRQSSEIPHYVLFHFFIKICSCCVVVVSVSRIYSF